MTRRTTAIHEAAHAVIAELLNGRVIRVDLDPRDASAGRTTHWQRKYKRRLCPITTGLISLAGHAAECIVYGRPPAKFSHYDMECVKRIGVNPRSRAFSIASWVALRLVLRNLPTIRRVAAELLHRGSLSRRQFLRVARG